MDNKSILTTKSLAVIAFIVAILSANVFSAWILIVFTALFVFAALVCKDKAGTADVLNAGLLYLGNCLIYLVFDKIKDIVNFIIKCADKVQNPKGLTITFDIIFFILWLAVIALAVLSIANLLMKKASNTIAVSPITNKILDYVPAKPVIPGAWTCSSCGKQNTGMFCAGCGNKKPQE